MRQGRRATGPATTRDRLGESTGYSQAAARPHKEALLWQGGSGRRTFVLETAGRRACEFYPCLRLFTLSLALGPSEDEVEGPRNRYPQGCPDPHTLRPDPRNHWTVQPVWSARRRRR